MIRSSLTICKTKGLRDKNQLQSMQAILANLQRSFGTMGAGLLHAKFASEKVCMCAACLVRDSSEN